MHRKCEPYFCNTSCLGVQLHSRKVLDAGKRAPLSVSDGIHPLLVHQGDAHSFPDFLEGLQHLSNQNQIKSLLLSHHHSTSALVSEILTSVLQTVQKTTIYIWTVHIYRLYRRQCAKYTYIYSVHIVFIVHLLSYQLHIIHRMCTSRLCTLSIHYVVYT